MTLSINRVYAGYLLEEVKRHSRKTYITLLSLLSFFYYNED